MYYTKQKSSNKKLIVIIVTIILIVVSSAGFALVKSRSNDQGKDVATPAVKPTNTVDYSPATTEDNAVNDDRKNVKDNTTDTPQSSSPVTSVPIPQITRVTVDNVGKQVQVGTQVSGVTSGTCTVIFSKTGQANVTASAQVTSDVNSYTCGVINIPFTGFTSRGSWTVSLQITSNGASANKAWPNPVVIPADQ